MTRVKAVVGGTVESTTYWRTAYDAKEYVKWVSEGQAKDHGAGMWTIPGSGRFYMLASV